MYIYFFLFRLQQGATCLSELDQSPSASVLESMQPFLNAVVKPELLKHQDRDVKLLVATCICEITRITAPEAPYSDDVLKVLLPSTKSQLVNWYGSCINYHLYGFEKFHLFWAGLVCRISFNWLLALLVDYVTQVVHHLVGELSFWRLLQNIDLVLSCWILNVMIWWMKCSVHFWLLPGLFYSNSFLF